MKEFFINLWKGIKTTFEGLIRHFWLILGGYLLFLLLLFTADGKLTTERVVGIAVCIIFIIIVFANRRDDPRTPIGF